VGHVWNSPLLLPLPMPAILQYLVTILSVTTTASAPIYQWFRNGVSIPGATTDNLIINEEGVYHAEVSQSGGACASTAINSESTTAVAPASLEIVIAYNTAYTACENTTIILEATRIDAVAANGTRSDVTTTLRPNLSYQWQHNGVTLSGATSPTISLTDISENGDYVLTASLDTYTPISNSLPVQLRTSETLTISSTSLISCDPNQTITLSTTTSLTGESFEWFRDGVNLNDSNEDLAINQPGTYQLVLLRNGCPLPSNELIISPLDPSLITLDADEDLVIPEGTSRVVTASGGDAYSWLDANDTEISTTASVTFSEAGAYRIIATIGNCTVSRIINVSYRDTFTIPNVITVNGDGINDQWIIPNTYSNYPEINVIIYNENGEEIVNVFDYQNNWPESTTQFTRQNMVFFYTIRNVQEILKQGTVTVIR